MSEKRLEVPFSEFVLEKCKYLSYSKFLSDPFCSSPWMLTFFQDSRESISSSSSIIRRSLTLVRYLRHQLIKYALVISRMQILRVSSLFLRKDSWGFIFFLSLTFAVLDRWRLKAITLSLCRDYSETSYSLHSYLFALSSLEQLERSWRFRTYLMKSMCCWDFWVLFGFWRWWFFFWLRLTLLFPSDLSPLSLSKLFC